MNLLQCPPNWRRSTASVRGAFLPVDYSKSASQPVTAENLRCGSLHFLVTIGQTVAQVINELGTIMEIDRLNAATVGIGNTSTVDEYGVIVIPTGTDLNIKRDTQISVVFHEDGNTG
jgi:hypothetical protein